MEPWFGKLAEGDPQGAWDLFDARYRRLVFATIKRLIADPDDLMDVFGTVCQRLSADDCAQLRGYSAARGASVATWLVAVVRNLTVDWLRRRDGRSRTTVPSDLTPLQREIFQAVCLDGASHAEAYETIQVRTGAAMPFPEFLRHLRETQRLAPCRGRRPARPAVRDLLPDDASVAPAEMPETKEAAERLADALAAHPDDVRVAVDLFVVEGMTAAEVARIVGWPGAKTVYNRVYRALASMRAFLERGGIAQGDL